MGFSGLSHRLSHRLSRSCPEGCHGVHKRLGKPQATTPPPFVLLVFEERISSTVSSRSPPDSDPAGICEADRNLNPFVALAFSVNQPKVRFVSSINSAEKFCGVLAEHLVCWQYKA